MPPAAIHCRIGSGSAPGASQISARASAGSGCSTGAAAKYVLAELSADASRPVAEKLLRQLLDVVQQGHELAGFALFLNGGVAAYDGDPDPVRLTDRAEAAVQASTSASAWPCCASASAAW